MHEKHWPNRLGDLAAQKRTASLADATALHVAKADQAELRELVEMATVLAHRVQRLEPRHPRLHDAYEALTSVANQLGAARKGGA